MNAFPPTARFKPIVSGCIAPPGACGPLPSDGCSASLEAVAARRCCTTVCRPDADCGNGFWRSWRRLLDATPPGARRRAAPSRSTRPPHQLLRAGIARPPTYKHLGDAVLCCLVSHRISTLKWSLFCETLIKGSRHFGCVSCVFHARRLTPFHHSTG